MLKWVLNSSSTRTQDDILLQNYTINTECLIWYDRLSNYYSLYIFVNYINIWKVNYLLFKLEPHKICLRECVSYLHSAPSKIIFQKVIDQSMLTK